MSHASYSLLFPFAFSKGLGHQGKTPYSKYSQREKHTDSRKNHTIPSQIHKVKEEVHKARFFLLMEFTGRI
ncbi:hypothetical protein L1887_01265 [Cichorium endivia]|nr:hypothetical protein L1887_01265 [Cichorium endivia]